MSWGVSLRDQGTIDQPGGRHKGIRDSVQAVNVVRAPSAALARHGTSSFLNACRTFHHRAVRIGAVPRGQQVIPNTSECAPGHCSVHSTADRTRTSSSGGMRRDQRRPSPTTCVVAADPPKLRGRRACEPGGHRTTAGCLPRRKDGTVPSGRGRRCDADFADETISP
jgi:hypothetical protein